MDDMCVLKVGESGHFTSTSTMVSTLYWMHELKLHTILSMHSVPRHTTDELDILLQWLHMPHCIDLCTSNTYMQYPFKVGFVY